MSRSRLIFIVFYLTALLIAAAGLRIASSRTFNKFSAALVTQNRLMQESWKKRLEFEGLITPKAISEKIEHEPESE
ncbi:MAG: hypothetical protein ACYTFK_03235 [Planctomycetota bacterium]